MARPSMDYADAKGRHLRRVVDYLRDRHRLEPDRRGAFPLIDVRRMLHYSGAAVFLEPIIGELKLEEKVQVFGRGSEQIVYLVGGKW